MPTENKPSQRVLDILCLQRLCPNCERATVSYLVYEADNEIYFECSSCSWDLSTKLDLVKDAGFYPN